MMVRTFSEELIVGMPKEPEVGMKAADLARRHGFSEATICTRKAKSGAGGG